MKTQSLVPKYVEAFFPFLAKNKNRENELEQLKAIANLFEAIPLFRKIFSSPLLKSETKQNILNKLFNTGVENEVLIFIEFLNKRNRLNLLPQIVKQLSQKDEEQKGFHTVKVVSTEKMDEENRRRLQEQLEKTFEKKFQLIEQIDPRILGGMVLEFSDNKILDHSVKNRLERLKIYLRSTKLKGNDYAIQS